MKALLTLLLCSLLTLTCAAQTDSTSRKPMNSAAFNKVLRTVQYQAATDNELVIRNTFSNSSNYYTTAQVRKLLAAVPKDSDKLIMARAAYERVTDPENFVKLADAFKSETYSREFAYWCKKPYKEVAVGNKENI